MDPFQNSQLQYQQFLDQLKAGAINREAFDVAVAQLRVQDMQGTWWSISPMTGIWCYWDGTAWIEVTQPAAAQTQPAEPPRKTLDDRTAIEPSIYAEFYQHYRQALELFRQGGMSEQQFQAKVERLRVKDEHGVWWQILPDTGQWVQWSGQQWIPTDPPRELVGAVGPVLKFAATVIDSTKEQVKETVRSIPRMIMWWLVSRGVMMAISYFGALYLHAYLCGYMNNGIRDDGGIWAPWLYLTQSKQGALSAPIIWGIAGMILSILVITTIRRGPSGMIKSFVRMPFSFLSMVKAGGRADAGAIAMGAGAAVVIKHFAGLNSQASYTLSLGMFLLGMGTVGRLISGFFLGIVRWVIAPHTLRLSQAVERCLPIDLHTLQLVLVGISPGFLLAPVSAIEHSCWPVSSYWR